MSPTTEEKTAILDEMKKRAVILAEGLNRIEGITCNVIAGDMYAFPVHIPARGRNRFRGILHGPAGGDGICVVPGSGFGQAEGTAHFRTTILPPTDKILRSWNGSARSTGTTPPHASHSAISPFF